MAVLEDGRFRGWPLVEVQMHALHKIPMKCQTLNDQFSSLSLGFGFARTLDYPARIYTDIFFLGWKLSCDFAQTGQ